MTRPHHQHAFPTYEPMTEERDQSRLKLTDYALYFGGIAFALGACAFSILGAL